MNDAIQPNCAVVVLGMHRSGTSVITRSLEACSVFLGDKLISGEKDNEKGFFEDAEINRLNEQFLAQLGGTWCSIFLAPADESLISEYIEKNLTVLSSRFSSNPLWAIKEPRITRLPFLWDRVLQALDSDVKYILANRHPFSVADSLKKRNELPRLHALVIWMIHQALGMSTLVKYGGLVVDYDIFMDNPAHELQRISNFIGAAPKHAEEFISGFLEKSLRHSKYSNTSEDDISEEPERLAMRMYTFLRNASRQNEPISREKVTLFQAELNQYLHQHKPYLEALDHVMNAYIRLQGISKQVGMESERLQAENRKLSSELKWVESRAYHSIPRAVKRIFK